MEVIVLMVLPVIARKTRSSGLLRDGMLAAKIPTNASARLKHISGHEMRSRIFTYAQTCVGAASKSGSLESMLGLSASIFMIPQKDATRPKAISMPRTIRSRSGRLIFQMKAAGSSAQITSVKTKNAAWGQQCMKHK